MSRHSTPLLRTNRLTLTLLAVADASVMVAVLADPELYAFTDGEPPSLDQLQARYRAQIAGSPDPAQRWHNWIIRIAETSEAVGFVQATVTQDDADIAWVVGVAWQRQGFAREAAEAMCDWLRATGVRSIRAHVHPDHHVSGRVAAACGLRATGSIADDGEQLWVSSIE
jgi:RimJ/RimL family protein N-acetyltransferase